MKNHIKKILLASGFFLCGCVVSALVFSMFFKAGAAGTCPVTVAAVQSKGTFRFCRDSNPSNDIVLSASDIQNLASELNALGVWTDEKVQLAASEASVDVLQDALGDQVKFNLSGGTLYITTWTSQAAIPEVSHVN